MLKHHNQVCLWRLPVFIPKYGLVITFWRSLLLFSYLCFPLVKLCWCWYNLFFCFAFILVGRCPKVSSKFVLVNYFFSSCISLFLLPLSCWLDAHCTLVSFTIRTGEKICSWSFRQGFYLVYTVEWFLHLLSVARMNPSPFQMLSLAVLEI